MGQAFGAEHIPRSCFEACWQFTVRWLTTGTAIATGPIAAATAKIAGRPMAQLLDELVYGELFAAAIVDPPARLVSDGAMHPYGTLAFGIAVPRCLWK